MERESIILSSGQGKLHQPFASLPDKHGFELAFYLVRTKYVLFLEIYLFIGGGGRGREKLTVYQKGGWIP